LFSLVLGNVAAFGLGYFPIKWFGALDLGVVFTGIWVLIVFVILMWLMSQSKTKVKKYRFRDEVLTFSIYVLCTASLLGHLMVFAETSLRTTARLVSVEQLDIDRKLIEDKRETNYNGYDFSQPNMRTYPPYDVVVEMAERYKLETTFDKEEISVKVHEIDGKLDRIYGSQLTLNMHQLSPEEIEYAGLICGREDDYISLYYWHIIVLLFVPMLLFLISHTNVRQVLLVAVLCFVLGLASIVFGFVTSGAFPLIVYAVLLAMVEEENGKTSRFVSLLIIPYTLMLIGAVSFFFLTMGRSDNETLLLIVSLILTITITVLGGAYFIKHYFEPSV